VILLVRADSTQASSSSPRVTGVPSGRFATGVLVVASSADSVRTSTWSSAPGGARPKCVPSGLAEYHAGEEA